MSRALVTGGAGFIGSFLCARLHEGGFEVTCLDNLATGTRQNVDTTKIDFVQHDVIEPFDGTFDVIFNFACPASPVHYQRDPIQTARTCFVGTYNMLELARRNGARLVQASTSEVYGDPEVHPQPETYRGCVNPIGPRACYDEGKRVAESLCFDFQRLHDTNVGVVRIFNTYGPRMSPDDGRVVSNFVVQALRGEDLTIFGDGSQTRSFCYVDDLVDGIVRMGRKDAPTGPINLGNPGEFTVRALAEIVLELTGSKSSIVSRPLPADDPTRRRPDISKAKEQLDWEPVVPLQEGLQKTIEFFRGQL